MKVSSGGFEQCYNAQLAVDMDSILIIDTVQAGNYKQQFEPVLKRLAALPKAPGKLFNLMADTGYCSDANVYACVEKNVTPLIAVSREEQYPDPLARVAPRSETSSRASSVQLTQA